MQHAPLVTKTLSNYLENYFSCFRPCDEQLLPVGVVGQVSLRPQSDGHASRTVLHTLFLSRSQNALLEVFALFLLSCASNSFANSTNACFGTFPYNFSVLCIYPDFCFGMSMPRGIPCNKNCAFLSGWGICIWFSHTNHNWFRPASRATSSTNLSTCSLLSKTSTRKPNFLSSPI